MSLIIGLGVLLLLGIFYLIFRLSSLVSIAKGEKDTRKDSSNGLNAALFLVFTVLGSIVTAGNILEFSDLLILGMSLPNILGLLLMSGKVRSELDEYWEKLKSGKLQR